MTLARITTGENAVKGEAGLGYLLATAVEGLPKHYKDPFDRFLIV